jgi:hypothetical protein
MVLSFRATQELRVPVSQKDRAEMGADERQ